MADQPTRDVLGPCPDPETMAAYLDNRLDTQARERVETHLAECEACYELAIETARTEKEAFDAGDVAHAAAPLGGIQTAEATTRDLSGTTRGAPVTPLRPRRAKWIVASAGVLAAAAAVVLVVRMQPNWLQGLWQSPAEQRMAALVDAVGEQRFVEGRLTGGFKYGPLRSPARGDAPATNLALLAAAGALQKAVESNPSAENLHAWGTAQVLLGKYDDGIGDLEDAVADEPTSARFQSDLAAAYLERARRLDRADDWPKGLAAAERALHADPTLTEAAFNQALAITALNLHNRAAEAWKAYLKLDSSSGFAAEARRHLAALDRVQGAAGLMDKGRMLASALTGDDVLLATLVRNQPQQLRELIEDELLATWAQSHRARGREAEEVLQRTTSLAQQLEHVGSDRLLSDAMADVNAALAQRDEVRIQRLAEGFIRFSQARQLYEANRVSEAAPVFQAAADALEAAGNPISLWCEHYLTIVEYYAGRYDDVRRRSVLLVQTAMARGYPTLTGRARWMIGLTYTLEARYSEQIAEHSIALGLFREMGERGNEAALHNLLATAYLYLGDQRAVWTHTIQSLFSSSTDQPRRRHTQLVSAANKATRRGLPEVALVLADEATAHARTWQAPEALVECEIYRARALALLNRGEEAASAARLARAGLARIVDPLLRARFIAEVTQTEAEVLISRDASGAARAAGLALEYFASQKAFLRVPRLYALQGIAYKRLGDPTRARQALLLGVERFERERLGMPGDEELRVSHFDDVWDAYRELLELMVSSGEPNETLFDIAERGKARSLSEQMTGGVVSEARMATVQSAVPDRTAIVYFTSLRNETLVWVIRSRSARFHRLPVAQRSLDDQVKNLVTLASRPGAEHAWRSEAESTFARLFAPLGLTTDDLDELVIVPDGSMYRVPFTALWNRSTNRFLIEDFVISVAPSAGFLLAVQPKRKMLGPTSHVAVIAPVQAVLDPPLPALPETKTEAQSIANAFPNATVFLEGAATLDAVRRVLQASDIVHFAGHALANPEYPTLSRLFLSDGMSGMQSVTTADLRSMDFRKVQLAVLSACGSLDGPTKGNDVPISLARALLAAGVPNVIASHWSVDDQSTARLMAALYREMARGATPQSALASAIRSEIGAIEGSRASWAAWVAIAGWPASPSRTNLSDSSRLRQRGA